MSIKIYQQPADFYILRFAEYNIPGVNTWEIEQVKVNGQLIPVDFFCHGRLFDEQTITISSKIIKDGYHLDYMQEHNAIIISEKLATVLLKFNYNAIQLLSIDITGCAEKYYILNTLHSVDFIDFDKSMVNYIPINGERRASSILIWQIKPHYITEKIFRCQNYELPLIIHKDVFAAMYDASITGCDYRNLEDKNNETIQWLSLLPVPSGDPHLTTLRTL